MRHQKSLKKFGRVRKGRTALMRSLALSLIKEEKINTTETKAKALRPYVEKLITKARNDTVASRRLVEKRLGQDSKKLFKNIAPRYKDRPGGYTRVTKLGNRESDGSPMARIELVK